MKLRLADQEYIFNHKTDQWEVQQVQKSCSFSRTNLFEIQEQKVQEGLFSKKKKKIKAKIRKNNEKMTSFKNEIYEIEGNKEFGKMEFEKLRNLVIA